MKTRPFFWSVRRELWEHRSLLVAPVLVAAVLLFGFLFSLFTLPDRMRAAALDPLKQHVAVNKPYDVVAGLLFLAVFIVQVFYCLEALHGERRDRSILFWKSLPVSDRTTVLSKASIPFVVMPAVTFVLVVACWTAMALLSSLALTGNARSVEIFWKHSLLVPMAVSLLYGLVCIALWLAPVWTWLLLVSAWAKRAPLVWALWPPLVISGFEAMASHGLHLTHSLPLIFERITGWYDRAFVTHPHGPEPVNPLADLTPGRFLGSPGLWIGLAFAALFLFGAIRIRRSRQPI